MGRGREKTESQGEEDEGRKNTKSGRRLYSITRRTRRWKAPRHACGCAVALRLGLGSARFSRARGSARPWLSRHAPARFHCHTTAAMQGRVAELRGGGVASPCMFPEPTEGRGLSWHKRVEAKGERSRDSSAGTWGKWSAPDASQLDELTGIAAASTSAMHAQRASISISPLYTCGNEHLLYLDDAIYHNVRPSAEIYSCRTEFLKLKVLLAEAPMHE